MLAIYKREMLSYFTSPIGYVFMGVFLAVSGFIFSLATLQQGVDSDVGTYFTIMLFVFVVVIPLLTMKSFSEERRSRTEQLLLTSPVSLFGMVFGKFLAAYTMFAITYIASCFNYIALYKFGNPNTGQLVGYSIAILLIGAAFVSVGIFISSLTENQIIAAIGTIAVILIFLLASFLNQYIDVYAIRAVLSWISVYSRFGNFTHGVFDFNAVLYYFSISGVFLFLTVRIYEKRRWE
ncbi:MAG TPA: ABC transporter permease [Bacillota bacterium]|nr:ABC transporter permease subunit [Clostridiales bacterium]HPT85870.1 ABC transporter permease [Bacillota bacterium]